MKNLLLSLALVAALLLSFWAGRLTGIQYVVNQAWHYIVELPTDDTDLYIELPDGNTYQTTLFIC